MARTPAKRARKSPRSKRPGPESSTDVREVPIEKIDWSSALRTANRAHVGRLADATTLPLLVVWEVERGTFRGVDGFHRWLLAKARGQRNVRAEVRHYPHGDFGEKRFDFDSIELNIQHGLPLTRYERDRAILRLWRRWARSESRPDGVTLEEIGKVFNLTKQRVGQIVRSEKTEMLATEAGGRTGFSSRFRAAAKRLTAVLRDASVSRQLIDERQPEMRKTLQELRDLLDVILREVNGSSVSASC